MSVLEVLLLLFFGTRGSSYQKRVSISNLDPGILLNAVVGLVASGKWICKWAATCTLFLIGLQWGSSTLYNCTGMNASISPGTRVRSFEKRAVW